MIPAREICRWLGLDTGALERLAAGDATAPQGEGTDALLDPLRIQDWLHRRSQRPAAGPGPGPLALLRETASGLATRQPLEAAFRKMIGEG